MPLQPLSEPKNRIERIVGFMKGSIAFSFLFPTLIALNGLQMISLILRPFSPIAFRRLNRFIANTWWGWCAIGAEKIYGIHTHYSGDSVPARENAIVILNHQEMADIPVLFSLARGKERLGDLKWFVKDILKYVPGIGWGMLFLDCLFIKRNWLADRERIHRVFQNIIDHDIPFWIISFVEGTRMKPAKLHQSQEYAKENGLKPLEHVLIPRTKGFVATVQALRNHIDAIYDLTLGYVDGVPTVWQWTKGYVHKVHLHVRRFTVDKLPTEDDLLASWLMERFREKDRLLSHFYQDGFFISEKIIK
jgi:1-acyl-sn-glycerol-3-phosphate acyltransferase